MIICKLDGGFGNHLYSYFLACILSHKLKQQIYIENNIILNDSLSQRKDTRETIYKIINNDYTINNIPNLYKKITIKSMEEYQNILNIDDIHKSDIVIDKILNVSFSFYNNYYDILQKYIKINNSLKFKNSIIISLRLGMGKNEIAQPSPFEKNLRLPFEYYKKAIQLFRDKNNFINTLIVCSDNFDDNYIDNFKIYSELNVVLCVNKNTLEQFEYIINADYFIASNSSFALFGVFLNRTGLTTIPNFKESNAVYPGKDNTRYSETLNINLDNCTKILL